jgi:hypothetical protein
MRKLASLIAKYEGKKSQARIGDIREVLKVFGVIGSLHDAFGEETIVGGHAALDDVTEYSNKMAAKVHAMKAKGLTPDEILQKLLGKRKAKRNG